MFLHFFMYATFARLQIIKSIMKSHAFIHFCMYAPEFLLVRFSHHHKLLHTNIFCTRLSTKVFNYDQTVPHIRQHYTNINCHNFHTFPSYHVTHTQNVAKEKSDKTHRMGTYTCDGLEEPKCAGSKLYLDKLIIGMLV